MEELGKIGGMVTELEGVDEDDYSDEENDF